MLHRNMPVFSKIKVGRFRAESLFHPESVAVIGAGSAEGSKVMANLLAGGFKGAVLPVESRQGSIRGVLAYPTIAALPIAPDMAVIATEEAEVPRAMAALADKGCYAGVVIGPGTGLVEARRATGMRVLGPGSFGIAVPSLGLNASLAHITPPLGKLAVASQSATLCRAVLDWAQPNGVGFSHIVGVGGNNDLGFATVVDWLARDPGTGAILLDIRKIKNRRLFLSAARAAAKLRPVVAIRPGGRLMDPTGNGERAFEAALRRAGVLSVTRIEDLLAAVETLARARPARSESLAIVSNAMGPGQLAADAVLRDGLQIAQLSAETEAVLRLKLPDAPPFNGYVHVGPSGSPARLAEVAALLAGAPEVGGVLVVHAPAEVADEAAIDSLAACAGSVRVPLLVSVMGETTAAAQRQRLIKAGMAVFATPEQAVRGFLHLVQDRRNRAAARELPPSTVLTVAPDRGAVRRLFERVRREGRIGLMQDEALDVLAAYDVPTVPGRTVASPDDALDAAALLGYPVCTKLRQSERPCDRARGGLALDLHDAGELRVAARLIAVRGARQGVPETGLLVQRQVGRSRELRARVADDPVFGPVIGFGQGGSTAEVTHDLALDLPPLNLPLAQALVARTRAAATLAGFRDMAAANVGAVAETLVRISQLVVDFPEIAEIDVNPLFADSDGVMVADAWMRLRAADEPVMELAIAPYPAELVERIELKGERLTIRPVRPEDAEQHGAFFRRLTPEDVRYRFFTAMRELSPEQLARLTQVDYDREMAFVAVRESTGETVGVSRLVCEGDGRTGEFAVVVQRDMKGKGLASLLMQRLMEWGRLHEVTDMVGQVLADNAPMIGFVRHLGFTLRRLPDEPDVVEAKMDLAVA